MRGDLKEKKCEARRDRIRRSSQAPTFSKARNFTVTLQNHPVVPFQARGRQGKNTEEELCRWALSPRRAAPPLLIQQEI